MKTKNLTIAFVAVAFAAGSAFATRNSSVTPNTRVWWKHLSTISYACTSIPLECSNQHDGLLCTVGVIKSDGTCEIVQAYKNAICHVPLKHTPDTSFAGIFDPGVEARPYDVADNPSGD